MGHVPSVATRRCSRIFLVANNVPGVVGTQRIGEMPGGFRFFYFQ